MTTHDPLDQTYDFKAMSDKAEADGARTGDTSDTGKDFEPIAEGDYTVECVEAEATSSKKDNPQINVQLRVLDDGEFRNRRVWDYLTLTEGNQTRFVAQLWAFGLDAELEHAATLHDLADLLEGREASVRVVEEVWDGKMKNKVDRYFYDPEKPSSKETPATHKTVDVPAQKPSPPIRPKPKFKERGNSRQAIERDIASETKSRDSAGKRMEAADTQEEYDKAGEEWDKHDNNIDALKMMLDNTPKENS